LGTPDATSLEDNVLEAASPLDAEKESRARAIDQLLFGRAGLVNQRKGVKDMLHQNWTINTHFGFGLFGRG